MRIRVPPSTTDAVAAARRQLLEEVSGCPQTDANTLARLNGEPFLDCPDCGKSLARFEAAIVARERERYEAQIDTMGKDSLWLSMEREALTFKKEEQQARIGALEAAVKAARGALEGLMFEVEKTSNGRKGGMRPASDTSAFAMVPPSGLIAIRRVVRDALAALDKEAQP